MTDPPQCKRCNKAASALDLRCKDCRSALRHKSTTPGQLFAALRQWEPSVQQEIDFIVEQILAKGVDPNARDELTDLSLLHFAAKSAAPGLGDELKAVAVVNRLIKAGADPNVVAKWTSMAPIHTAAFFGCPAVIAVLLQAGAQADMPCRDFEGATPLHLAALVGSIDSVEALVEGGANTSVRDIHKRTALDCAKLMSSQDLTDVPREDWNDIISILSPKGKKNSSRAGFQTPQQRTPKREGRFTPAKTQTPSRMAETADGPWAEVGDRVIVNEKPGLVRYRGAVSFKPGEWLGVQLDEPDGKNNGSVAGVEYFRCKPKLSFPGFLRVRTLCSPLIPANDLLAIGCLYRQLEPKWWPRRVQVTRSHPFARLPRGGGSQGEAVWAWDTASAVSHSPPLGLFVIQDTCALRLCEHARYAIDGLHPHTSGARFDPTHTWWPKRRWPCPRRPRHVQRYHVRGVYVGPTEFAGGPWIGLILPEPSGKHDGEVEGHRYFRCDPDCGTFVRPKAITYRGIRGDTLF